MKGAFDEAGYTVFPDAVPSSTITYLRAEADRIRDELLDAMNVARAFDPRVTWWRLGNGRLYLLKIKPVVDLASAASALTHGDWMQETMAELLGASPLLMEDKFMYKQQVDMGADWAELPVLSEEVCKHTDAAYFRTRGYDRVITVAVCLDDCTADAGALKVWPGTHHRDVAMTVTARQGPVVSDHDAPDDEAITLTAKAGSVLVWDSALVHASGPNTSGRPRRLLVLGYAPVRPQSVDHAAIH